MQHAAYLLALSRIEGVGAISLKKLLEEVPEPAELFSSPEKFDFLGRNFYKRVVASQNIDHLLEEASLEIDEASARGDQVIGLGDPLYPVTLAACADPPSLFYYRGNENALHSPHCISIVGTRNATRYGQKVVDTLLEELAQKLPDLVIVSGLAYGIDILAHRAALRLGIPTIAVLAHGLDRIYPYVHRKEANAMVEQGGGLLTEYSWGTQVERHHFVARNRIVAGISHATLVVESAHRGGSLLTAAMASGYGRDVFAVPGRITDPYSEGCNRIIASMQAIPAIHADNILFTLGWSEVAEASAKAPSLFQDEDLPDDPVLRRIVEEETIHFNELVTRLNMPAAELMNRLVALEFDGLIATLPGGIYTKA